MKSIDINHQGQLGVAWVTWIVEGLWGAGVEIISAHNDDGIDALIMLKKRRKSSYAGPTGDIIFAQIKTGYVRRCPTGDYSINLTPDYLQSHLPRWLSYPGPVVIINVIPPRLTGGQPLAFWANLRTDCYNKNSGSIKFSIKNKFDLASKSDYTNLCWRWAELRKLPLIRANKYVPLDDVEINIKGLTSSSKGILFSAKQHYLQWKVFSKNNPDLFIAKITWRGWNHITRFSRPNDTKFQSLLLLPVAMRMLLKSEGLAVTRLSAKENVVLKCGQERSRWYESIVVRVTFYERHETVVRVILECTEIKFEGETKSKETCFYSLHELARRKSFS